MEIELIDGFFHKDGMGYSVNFLEGTAEIFPFEETEHTHSSGALKRVLAIRRY